MIIKDYYSSTYFDPNEQENTLSLVMTSAWIAETDEDRYFNVTNATIPVLHLNGLVRNFIHLRIDSDIYRVIESYLVDMDISNLNAALYPALYLLIISVHL